MYKWEYVKGQRAPQAALAATVTSGAAPLAGRVLERGLARSGSGGLDRRSRGTSTGDGTVDSTDPDPTFTYTQNGVYTAPLTVTDSSGKTDTKTTTITVGNTAPT